MRQNCQVGRICLMSHSGMALAQHLSTGKCFNAHSLALVLFAFNLELVATTMNGRINVNNDRASLCELWERA